MNKFTTASLSSAARLGVLIILAVLVYGALLKSGFYSDDWTFLTLAKHGDGPLGFFVHDHSLTYMYRPVALMSWWGLVHLGDVNAGLHYGFALLVHSLNAFLLGALAIRWGMARIGAFLLSILFLLHPAAGATVSWLADRFDLMMSLGVLLVLWSSRGLVRSGSGRWWWVIAGAVLLAVGSKETGLSALPLLGLAVLCGAMGWRHRIGVFLLMLIFVIAYFVVRAHVLGSLEGIADKAGSLMALLHGTALWFRCLPKVLFAFAGQGWQAGLLLLWLLPIAWVVWRRDWARLLIVVQLMSLLGLLALMQAPVTSIVLDQESPFQSLVNYRFYYLAVAASLLLFGLCLQWLVEAYGDRHFWSGGALVALILVVALNWGVSSYQAAWLWQQRTAGADRLAVANAARSLAESLPDSAGGGCLIRLTGASGIHTDLPGYSDLLVKAQLPSGHPALNCVFASERMPWKVITQWQSYIEGGLGIPAGREFSFHSGVLAVHVKTAADADEWQWRRYTYADNSFRR